MINVIYYKNHEYLPLNRSSKVCMKKGPARHTRTPPSSLHEPNIILILYFLYCPTATRFLGAQHFPIPRTSRFKLIYYLMNVVAALPVDRRRAQFFITALLQVPLSSILTVFASLQACAIARWFIRSAAIRGESDDPAYESQGRVLQSL